MKSATQLIREWFLAFYKEAEMNDKSVIQQELLSVFERLARECSDNSKVKGFWSEGIARNRAEMIALMHSELSEMLEGVRKPGPDAHCPDFTSEEIEAADVLIRLFDYASGFKLRLGEALIAKMKFNATRPYKHGKAF